MFARVDGGENEDDGNDVDGRSGNLGEKRLRVGQVANEGLRRELGRP